MGPQKQKIFLLGENEVTGGGKSIAPGRATAGVQIPIDLVRPVPLGLNAVQLPIGIVPLRLVADRRGGLCAACAHILRGRRRLFPINHVLRHHHRPAIKRLAGCCAASRPLSAPTSRLGWRAMQQQPCREACSPSTLAHDPWAWPPQPCPRGPARRGRHTCSD